MNIAVGITTVTNRLTYLPTVASLLGAGFPRATVVGVDDRESGAKCGPWLNFKRTLGSLMEMRPDADAYAMFQDDVELTRGCFAGVSDFMWDASLSRIQRIGVLSLFKPDHVASRCPGAGWHPLPPDKVVRNSDGALGVIMPAHSARELLDRPPRASGGVLNQTDVWLGLHCSERGLDWWTHEPSLIKHTGRKSTLTDNDMRQWENRQCRTFLTEWPDGPVEETLQKEMEEMRGHKTR